MLLSLSSQTAGLDADVTAAVNSEGDSGVEQGELLINFTTAAVKGEPELAKLRAKVLSELGPLGLVGAAAIIGNFSMVNRIADATGIPLDPAIEDFYSIIPEDLGLEKLPGAVNTFG